MSVLQRRPLLLPLALDDEDLLFVRLQAAQHPPRVPDLVHPTTLRIYEQLPLAYRDADEQLGWPLLSWVSLLCDQLGEITDLTDRIDIRDDIDGGQPSDTSALTDPTKADAAWLPWLAQHFGISISGLSTQAARDAISGAASGYAVGTKGAIAAAAQSALTGSRHVEVLDHTISAPGDGTQWDVCIISRAEETPSGTAVINAVIAAGAKPAGVVLHQRTYAATWASMQAAYPTWTTRNGKTWLQLEEAGL